ncbi:S41 family peptidase [Thermotomaculum hydrothermale]|nr:S41 family peptidase [Thermotomaculum hydrothermale]
MKKIGIFVFIFLFALTQVKAENPVLRFPSLSPDGSKIAFEYQGDIFVANIDGTNVKRLTVHQAYDAYPVFSPDGSEIAFTSDRFGHFDVFKVSVEGSVPERVTYYGSPDVALDWSKKYGILFSTLRNFRQVEWEREIFSANLKDKTPKRILNAVAQDAKVSPDGKLIALVKGECRIAREAYKGSANRDLWIYNVKKDKYFKITEFNGQDFNPVWVEKRKLYFLSARDGRHNVYSLELNNDGSKVLNIKQITFVKDFPINYMSASKDGKVIAYEKAGKIYILKDGKTKEFSPSLSKDYVFDPIKLKNFSSKIESVSVSPNGKFIAFSVHGEVFVKLNDDKKTKSVNISKSPFRDRDVAWIDDYNLVFSSDRSGNYDLYLAKSADKRSKNLYTALKFKIVRLTDSKGEERKPIVSPDGKRIIYRENNGKLIIADINLEKEKLENKRVLLDGWATPEGVTFSPDGNYIAYSIVDLTFNEDVYILPLKEGAKPVNVSMFPRGDKHPVWSPDGSKLAFLSQRNRSDYDVWFVWLKKSDYQKTKQDWEDEKILKQLEEKDKKKEKSKKEKNSKKEEKKKPIQIDFDEIYNRVVQVTSLPGDEGGLAFSKDGEKIYYTTKLPGKKDKDLFSIKWDGTETKAITRDGRGVYNLTYTKHGLFFLRKRGTLAKVSLKSNKVKSLPFSARMRINYPAELNQMFEEGWRILKYNFYDPEFHGRNWNKLKKLYKPICLAATNKHDFRDYFNEMLGQLNASHMGLYGGGRENVERESVGRIGVEVEPLKKGVKVTHIVPDSPADKEFSKLYVGDVILSVNGNEVTRDTNFWSFFSDTVNKRVYLDVKGKDGKIREVVIRPVASLRNELYREYVEFNRKLVEKYSNGKLGYIHIQGMDMPSFERFERDLEAAGKGKEGLVIDVRFNGGGWTTDYLMAILNVKQHAYTIPRGATDSLKNHLKFRNYYPFAERLPFYPWTKPSIALCNSSSYSNAEIFSHAYKTLGIGKLVGRPTFGAVISTDGETLIDGMYIRKPFRAWFVYKTDKDMEGNPAIPDYIVNNPPDWKVKGEDLQLKKACEVLLKEIDKKK